MTKKIGINGFGRIGRLAFRILWECPDVEIVQVNDPGGDARVLAHLLTFDSIHGQWSREAHAEGEFLVVDDRKVHCSGNREISETDWSGCDYVIEATGKMKKTALLQDYLDQGVKSRLPFRFPGTGCPDVSWASRHWSILINVPILG